MFPFKHAKPVKRGDPLSARAQTEIVRQVSGLSISTGVNALWDGRGLYTRKYRPARFVIIIGQITASVLQEGHQARWNYTVQPAQFNNAGAIEEASHLDEITAINLAELAHTAEPSAETPWYVWGVDAHQEGMTLTPLPVGGGTSDGEHTVDFPVELHLGRLFNGSEFYYFNHPGSFYAECES